MAKESGRVPKAGVCQMSIPTIESRNQSYPEHEYLPGIRKAEAADILTVVQVD
jgi:hypothetical protein